MMYQAGERLKPIEAKKCASISMSGSDFRHVLSAVPKRRVSTLSLTGLAVLWFVAHLGLRPTECLTTCFAGVVCKVLRINYRSMVLVHGLSVRASGGNFVCWRELRDGKGTQQASLLLLVWLRLFS